MSRGPARLGVSLALLLVALAILAAPARAQDEGPGLLSRLSYGVSGGAMFPVAPQGDRLRRGGHFGGVVYGETSFGILLGAEGAYTMSQDPLGTRIAMLGMVARLSPIPEDYRAYVQIGAGAYHLSYEPDPGFSAPATNTRPGGSFGVGGEFIEVGRVVFGATLAYHGVILARSEAISYMVAAVTATFKPSLF